MYRALHSAYVTLTKTEPQKDKYRLPVLGRALLLDE
jgi:hypothetical protein